MQAEQRSDDLWFESRFELRFGLRIDLGHAEVGYDARRSLEIRKGLRFALADHAARQEGNHDDAHKDDDGHDPVSSGEEGRRGRRRIGVIEASRIVQHTEA